jgi:hypothetical protein
VQLLLPNVNTYLRKEQWLYYHSASQIPLCFLRERENKGLNVQGEKLISEKWGKTIGSMRIETNGNIFSFLQYSDCQYSKLQQATLQDYGFSNPSNIVEMQNILPRGCNAVRRQ